MGLTIGSNSSTKVINFQKADGTVAGTRTIGISKVKNKKKKLPYNFKAISVQLLKTKTSGNASRVVTKARGKIAELKKMLKTGEYDDKELEAAILHAEQIAKVAKKRAKHLKEEENVKTHGGVCEAELEEETFDVDDIEEQSETELDIEEIQELMQEFQEIMKATMEQIDDVGGIEELSEELMVGFQREMDPADLELLKKKHRSDELREIMEADMKYLKAVFDKLEKEKSEASSGGVSLEIGGVEMSFAIADVPVSVVVEGGNVDVSV